MPIEKIRDCWGAGRRNVSEGYKNKRAQMKANKRTLLWQRQERNKTVKQKCKECPRIDFLTVDHIIPVFFLQQLGLDEEAVNDEENMEDLCVLCNRYKGGRIDMRNPKTIPLLKKYITKLERLSTPSN
jgi:5-methylcytosine-specific restriction endonuclease McrA